MNRSLNQTDRHGGSRNGLRARKVGIRLAVVLFAPAVAYAVIRPLVGSDAAALAAAGRPHPDGGPSSARPGSLLPKNAPSALTVPRDDARNVHL